MSAVALSELIAPSAIDYSSGEPVVVPVRVFNGQLHMQVRSPLTNRHIQLPDEAGYYSDIQSMMSRLRWLKPMASMIWPLDDEEGKLFSVFNSRHLWEHIERQLEQLQKAHDRSLGVTNDSYI